MSAAFEGGVDVAMKVPPHQYQPVLNFYRDVVGLKEIGNEGTRGFELGPIRLWIDESPGMSQAETPAINLSSEPESRKEAY